MGLKMVQTPEPDGRGHLRPSVSPDTHVDKDCLKMEKAAQVQARAWWALRKLPFKENKYKLTSITSFYNSLFYGNVMLEAA